MHFAPNSILCSLIANMFGGESTPKDFIPKGPERPEEEGERLLTKLQALGTRGA